MNVAFFLSSSLMLQSLVCSWTAVGHAFFLAVCSSGHLCSICSAVWSSRPKLQASDGASFIFLKMWALHRLWPRRNVMTAACCHRSRKWNSPLPVRCPRAALMRVFFSWKVTLLSCCLPLAPGLGFRSLFLARSDTKVGCLVITL